MLSQRDNCTQANNRRMNIYAPKGWKVVYIAATDERDDIFNAGRNAIQYLRKDQIYTVNMIFECCSFTMVELEEFPGIFFYSNDFIDCP
ncbi:MAG: hypothetical protein APF84_17870 [Gracilibacter sp. BRH_c7a]|nr:MAG: hypothetical protein APF84_17870 [Gracilibacter sp. BRH_c7a]